MTQIDTSRRGFLKSAVAASAAMMSAAAVHAGIPAKSVAKYDETFDVVIIGSGFAGMACALKAGRAGLKVLMIEKMSTVGGNSAICGGNVACPVNPVQKAQGIKDSKELFIADCLKDGLGINHTNLLSTIADRCNDTIQMVVDCGCEFVPNKMLFEGGHSVPRSYEIKAGTGSGYIRPMHEELKKLKNVVIRTRCKFDDFVMEEDGSVAGIVCRTGYRFNNKAVSDDLENKTGKKSVVRATKGVMLAAGGFSGNRYLRELHDPRVKGLGTDNLPGSTGEVAMAAVRVGAYLVGMDFIQSTPGAPAGKKMKLLLNFNVNGSIYVDKRGNRIVNEGERRDVIRDAVLGTPERYGYTVCDNTNFMSYDAVNRKAIMEGIKINEAWTAPTIRELAEKMGVDPDGLEKTIKRYNEVFVKNGRDDDFHKQPVNLTKRIEDGPFWACYTGMTVHHTMGGINTNVKAQALDWEGKVIPGLYAAGEITGGIHGTNRVGGNAVLDCFVFGQIAGENAAKEVA